MSEIIRILLEKLSKLIEEIISSENVKKLFKAFVKNRKKLTIVAISLIIIIISLSYNYYKTSKMYEHTLQKTLKTINSDNYSQGFEAYILSNVSDSLIKTPFKGNMRKNYQEYFKNIQERLTQITFDNAWIKRDLGLKVADTGKSSCKIITDNTDGFLFVPKILIRNSSNRVKFEKLNLDQPSVSISKKLDKLIASESNLKKEIYYTQQIAKIMSDFSEESLYKQDIHSDLHPIPSQIYVITQSGVVRIMKDGKKHSDLERYFAKQFPSRTFFPSRKYYVDTFNEEKSFTGLLEELHVSSENKVIEDFFCITGPYLDLGGDGIVYTLSRGIRLKDNTEMAICFDFKIDEKPMESIITKTLHNINADTFIVEAKLEGEKKNDLKIKENKEVEGVMATIKESLFETITSDREEILKNLNIMASYDSQRTLLLGGISVLKPSEPKSDDGTLVFTIPLSGISISDGEASNARIMIAKIDLNGLDKNSNLLIITALILLLILTGLIAYAWSDDLRSRETYQKAFHKVDEVMKYSSVAYARLDNEDNIAHFSLAFCELFGYYENGHLDRNISKKKFVDLCSNKAKRVYQEVQKKRQFGQKVEPYDLVMLRKDGSEIEVRIISATVPSTESNGIPETFGIVIPKADSKQNEYLNYIDLQI